MLHPRIETVQLFGNSRLEGLFACDRHQVVRALDERLSSDVIFTFTLRGVELGVIRSTRRFVDQAAFNPAHEQIVVDFEFKRRVELLFSLLEQVIKLFCLSHVARESIQQETGRTSRRVEVIPDEPNDNLVIHQLVKQV